LGTFGFSVGNVDTSLLPLSLAEILREAKPLGGLLISRMAMILLYTET
jgi:hypothetical protein